MEVLKKNKKSIVFQDEKDIYLLNKYGTVIRNKNILDLVEIEKQEEIEETAAKHGYAIDKCKKWKGKVCLERF